MFEKLRTKFYEKETVNDLLDGFKRRKEIIDWLIGSYGGIFFLLSLDTIFWKPAWASKTIITLGIIGVAVLALARVGFGWGITLINRSQNNVESKPKLDSMDAVKSFFAEEVDGKRRYDPAKHELQYRFSFFIILLLGGLLLYTTWL